MTTIRAMRKLVAGVIFHKKKYIILRRRLGWRGWEFVKGNTDGEGYKRALLREIREDTGPDCIHAKGIPCRVCERKDKTITGAQQLQVGGQKDGNETADSQRSQNFPYCC